MVATKRPTDLFAYQMDAEQGVLYRFAVPLAPPLPPATPRVRGSAKASAPPDPERFDWFTALLYVALAVGLLLIAALSYVVFLPPTPVTLP